jgi:hypothetical protein
MKSHLSAIVVAAGLIVFGATVTAAEAQTHRSHLGPRISYNTDIEEVAIGAQFSTPIASFLEFYPSFDYYLVDPGSLWAVNADLKLRVTGESLKWLYLGAGLNVTRASVGPFENTDTGLNLFTGFETIGGYVHPFGELRLTVADGSSVQFAFGLNFTLGSR